MSLQSWVSTSGRDLGIRVVKTAIQTFVGVVGANVAGWTSLDAIQSAGVVALAAAATVVINYVLTWANR